MLARKALFGELLPWCRTLRADRGHRARGTLDPHKSTNLGIVRSVRGMYSPRFAPPRVHTLNRNRLAWRTSAQGLGLYLQAGYERIKTNYFGSFS